MIRNIFRLLFVMLFIGCMNSHIFWKNDKYQLHYNTNGYYLNRKVHSGFHGRGGPILEFYYKDSNIYFKERRKEDSGYYYLNTKLDDDMLNSNEIRQGPFTREEFIDFIRINKLEFNLDSMIIIPSPPSLRLET